MTLNTGESCATFDLRLQSPLSTSEAIIQFSSAQTSSAQFSVKVIEGSPASIRFFTYPSTTLIGTVLAQQPELLVTDVVGNAIGTFGQSTIVTVDVIPQDTNATAVQVIGQYPLQCCVQFYDCIVTIFRTKVESDRLYRQIYCDQAFWEFGSQSNSSI